jgi:cytochrome c oxidase subunit 1
VTEARPQLRESSPTPSIWPLIAAVAVGATFVGSIFTPWAVVWGAVPISIALVGWFWPSDQPEDRK